jgi:hypothetical protein
MPLHLLLGVKVYLFLRSQMKDGLAQFQGVCHPPLIAGTR